MKIEIYFLNSKLTTEIDKDIKVHELLTDLKNYFKMKDANFILFDSNKRQLKDSENISIKKNATLSFYLIKSNLHIFPKKEINEKINPNVPLNEIIMKTTGAKKLLEKKVNIENRGFNFLDLFDNRNNNNENNQQRNEDDSFDRLINIIQFFNDSGIRPIRIQNNSAPVEADEKALRELQDMGFAEDRARQALINSRNDISKATDILLGEMGE